jgi:hypothetical protein
LPFNVYDLLLSPVVRGVLYRLAGRYTACLSTSVTYVLVVLSSTFLWY